MTQDMMQASEPRKLLCFGFVFIFIVSTINFTAFGMLLPIFPGFTIGFGASLSTAGLIVGMFAVVALIGRPFSSIMGDRLNKKYLLIIALCFSGLTIVLYALAPSLSWVIPIRVVHGLMFSISGAVVFALGAGFIPKKRMGEGIGILGMGQIIGTAIGPNVGVYLVENFSYELCFLISGGAVIAAGLAVFVLRYNHAPAPQAEKRPLRIGDFAAVELLPNALFVSVIALGLALVNSYLVLFGQERGISRIGLYFIVHAIVIILTRPFIGRMVDKKGVAYAVLPGYIIAAGAMVLIALASSLWMVLLAGVLFAVGGGGAMPAIQADCLNRLGRARSTVATSTYMIGLDISFTVGPIFGGIVADVYGFGTAFTSAAILMLIGCGLYFVYSRRRRDSTS